MLGRLLRWAIVLYLAGLAWQAAPIYWHFTKLRERAAAIARAGANLDDGSIAEQVFEAAQELHVPLSRDAIVVDKERYYVTIEASYVERLQWLPSRYYEWKFRVTADSRRATL